MRFARMSLTRARREVGDGTGKLSRCVTILMSGSWSSETQRERERPRGLSPAGLAYPIGLPTWGRDEREARAFGLEEESFLIFFSFF